MARKDDLGRLGERIAAEHCLSRGLAILDRNWRSPRGELDLVAADADWVVVVEVKTRRGDAFGHPFEAIDHRKRVRLALLAREWVRAHPDSSSGRGLRVDAIAVTIDAGRTRVEHVEDVA